MLRPVLRFVLRACLLRPGMLRAVLRSLLRPLLRSVLQAAPLPRWFVGPVASRSLLPRVLRPLLRAHLRAELRAELFRRAGVLPLTAAAALGLVARIAEHGPRVLTPGAVLFFGRLWRSFQLF